jgi:hypothetical protein
VDQLLDTVRRQNGARAEAHEGVAEWSELLVQAAKGGNDKPVAISIVSVMCPSAVKSGRLADRFFR